MYLTTQQPSILTDTAQKLVFIDWECAMVRPRESIDTGAGSGGDIRICEIAFLITDTNRASLESWSSLVNHGSDGMIAVADPANQITEEDIVEAPTLAQLAKRIGKALNGATVLCYDKTDEEIELVYEELGVFLNPLGGISDIADHDAVPHGKRDCYVQELDVAPPEVECSQYNAEAAGCVFFKHQAEIELDDSEQWAAKLSRPPKQRAPLPRTESTLKLDDPFDETTGEAKEGEIHLDTDTADFKSVIEELKSRTFSDNEKKDLNIKGERFERLMLEYFRRDPYWMKTFSEIHLWNDWPDSERPDEFKGSGDIGVDLVAKYIHPETGESDWCAIQCKFYKNNVDGPTVQKFIGAAAGFREAIMVCSSDLSKNGKKAAEQAGEKFHTLNLQKLEQSKFSWPTLKGKLVDAQYTGETHDINEHQLPVLTSVIDGIYRGDKDTKPSDRAQMHLPCGFGKTFTSLRIAEAASKEVSKKKKEPFRVLYCVPSISLMGQTMREWAEQSDPALSYKYIGVCSDRSTGKARDDTIGYLHELEGEVTTNPEKILDRMLAKRSKVDILVTFTTYHSIHLVAEAQRHGAPDFDLVLCDEAHRTASVAQEDENWTDFDSQTGDDKKVMSKEELEKHYGQKFHIVHKEEFIKADKRLYMTATPKVYGDVTKAAASEAGNVGVYSMDDETTFGPVLAQMSFLEAVQKGILCQYEILIVAIDPEFQQYLDDNKLLTEGDDLEMQIKALGTVKALAGDDEQGRWLPLPRTIAFNRLIRDSKKYADSIPVAASRLNSLKDTPEEHIHIDVKHIDGNTPSSERRSALDWLEGAGSDDYLRMLTNAQCLGEGVDVPALDGVIFMSPKKSVSDIVQQVGRVMRTAPDKEQGYVIIPMIMGHALETGEQFRSSSDYKTVKDVIRALKSHDEMLADHINTKSLTNIGVRHVTALSKEEREKRTNVTPEEKEKLYQQIALTEQSLVEAIKVEIYNSVSDREYWTRWATDVAEETKNIKNEILEYLKTTDNKPIYDEFLAGARETMSPNMTDEEAVSFLAQFVVCKPVFEALYSHYDFANNNDVAKILNRVCGELEAGGVGLDLRSKYKNFYRSVEHVAKLTENTEQKYELVKELYETYLTTAFPAETEKLGVVYTPTEIVDWLAKSTDDILRAEFGVKLEDPEVDILDAFTGAGTFLVRLIQMEHQREDEPERTHLISDEALDAKFDNGIYAMEYMPTPYFVADISIEEAYHQRKRQAAIKNGEDPDQIPYRNYDNIAMGDTFLQPMKPSTDGHFKDRLFGIDEGNTKQLNKIAQKKITVSMGNPPWRAQQKDATDNNQNNQYPELDSLIDKTYAAHSSAALKNSLYDLYLKALRWSSERIGDEGIISFVTNGGWLDGAAASGVRACLEEEFDAVYVYNLRGRLGTEGDGGNVFDVKVPVTMLILVKNPNQTKKRGIFYTESSEGLSKADKLSLLSKHKSLDVTPWNQITPDRHNDWINQRDETYSTYFVMGDKETKKGDSSNGLMQLYSTGATTQRDLWAYDSNSEELVYRSQLAVDFYNQQLDSGDTAEFTANPEIFKWHGEVKKAIERGTRIDGEVQVRKASFRPFYPQYMHYEKVLNSRHGVLDQQFPLDLPASNVSINVSTKGTDSFDSLLSNSIPDRHLVGGGDNLLAGLGIVNLAICVTDKTKREFSILMTRILPDRELVHHSQTFSLFRYEKLESVRIRQGGIFDSVDWDSLKDGDVLPDGGVIVEGSENMYVRYENILDETLQKFQDHYKDDKITKEDIFFFNYGILHHEGYRKKYKNDLSKGLPRLPFPPDFHAFAEAGRKLGALHVGYESLPGYDGLRLIKNTGFDEDSYDSWAFTTKKQKLKQQPDGTWRMKVNDHLIIADIPAEAQEYKVNGKTALGWLADRYRIHEDKKHASGIVNDANALFDDPRDYVKLVEQIVQLSVETVEIVNSLPEQFE